METEKGTPRAMRIFGTILVLLLLAGCETTSDTGSPALQTYVDSFTGEKTHYPKITSWDTMMVPLSRSPLTVSIFENEDETTLQVFANYRAADWIFADSVSVKADGEAFYFQGEFNRDVLDGGIIKESLFLVDADRSFFDRVSTSDEVIVRFSGKRSVNLYLRDVEIQAFRVILDAFDSMSSES